MYIIDAEYDRLLNLLEQTGSVLMRLKYQMRRMCSENAYVKSSTIIDMCDTIKSKQIEFARLDDMLTELESTF